MEKPESKRIEKDDPARTGYPENNTYEQAFTEFKKTVDRRLEDAILERIRAFREGILKLRNTR